MNTPGKLIETIFSSTFDFHAAALNVFSFQYNNNEVYRKYVDAIGVNPETIKEIKQIPFLPIRFFKTHIVTTTNFSPQTIFESSGTTETINSKHFVKSLALYEQSFLKGFNRFYSNASDWCIIGLLPSYLERKNSSLVYMVNKLIKESGHQHSGFYLNEFEALAKLLQLLESQKQKTLLIGVTFALLDFAKAHAMPLTHVTLMETGGMKGRKKEMIREEIHEILKNAFSLKTIHSEYGMTELLSQAYSQGKGIFETPRWMKVLVRDEDDPFTVKTAGTKPANGVLNIIDLANIYSCSFIATDDLGTLYPNGSFEVKGRIDNSDLRGCSLMVI